MSKSVFFLTLATALAPAIHADIDYRNNLNDLGTSTTGLVEAGNQIGLAGTARYLTSASFQSYNQSVSPVGSGATLNIFSLNDSTLDVLLGSYNLAPQSFLGIRSPRSRSRCRACWFPKTSFGRSASPVPASR